MEGEHNYEKPKIGMEFTEVQMAFDFYNTYAGKEGFSIRVDYQNTDRRVKSSKVITNSRFVCYKAGYKRPDKRDYKCRNPRSEVRVGCLARLGVRLDRDLGKYVIYDFKEEHNHELAPLQTRHMLKSQRKVLDAQAEQIDIAADSGIGLGASFELLGCQKNQDLINDSSPQTSYTEQQKSFEAQVIGGEQPQIQATSNMRGSDTELLHDDNVIDLDIFELQSFREEIFPSISSNSTIPELLSVIKLSVERKVRNGKVREEAERILIRREEDLRTEALDLKKEVTILKRERDSIEKLRGLAETEKISLEEKLKKREVECEGLSKRVDRLMDEHKSLVYSNIQAEEKCRNAMEEVKKRKGAS